MKFNLPARGNKKLERVAERIRGSERLTALWRCSNVNSIDRLGFNDHGPVHVAIVANAALKLLRTLVDGGVAPSIVKNYHMEVDDAEVVVVLASVLHDIGMTVHRADHELFSIILAPQILPELIADYQTTQQVIITSEVLHSLSHYSADRTPFTIEAGVVRIADALDMSEGRSRIPFEKGQVGIHSVSAQAIDDVDILRGDKKPVKIMVKMNNSAGIFQVDELLKPRIKTSGLSAYIDVEAVVTQPEKHIVKRFKMQG